MTKYVPEQGSSIFTPLDFDQIYSMGATNAATAASRNPRLMHLLHGGTPGEYAEKMRQPEPEQYLAAARVLESDHLTLRQQEIARLVVGLAVVFEPRFTDESFSRVLGTRRGTVLAATSTLASRRDQYVPRGLRFEYRLPLLTQVTMEDGNTCYAPSEALHWCVEEPNRYPVIDEAIQAADDIRDLVLTDSL